MTLEHPEEQTEQTEPVLETKQVEEVSTETTEVSEKAPDIEGIVGKRLAEAKTTWTQSDEFKKAVQSEKDKSIAKEMQPLKDKIRELDQKAQLADLIAREKQELVAWGDTDEVKDFQAERRRHLEERVKFESEKAETQALAQAVAQTNKMIKAKELATQYGVSEKILLRSNSPEEMEDLAKELKESFEEVRTSAKEVPEQKVDSGIKSVSGPNLKGMTPREEIEWAVAHEKKKK